ncbi:MAG TPA: efflux RND transporter periplasmic adaptor subunit [Leeuwenhoekiella sp.]|nr:efflux RND transporter periplasmic adaptor subunit [Leeuwenhoekiella sp.]
MNKNLIYIGIAVLVGLLAGWLIFGISADKSMAVKDVSTMSDNHEHSAETAEGMWTCSMHPQIMQPEPGDCPICGMDLIPAESSADGLAAHQFKMTKNAMALANIQTSIVGDAEGKNGNIISLTGKIVENEEANSVQASYFDGRIERLNVSYEGQEVRKGQLLATIYAPNLVAAQQELITTASLKESQPELYKSVRNKLKLWKLSQSQINSIEESGKVRENFPIYATVSGTVSEKMADEGDYVKQGQPILKLSNLNSVWAEFDAYENQISLFKKGQKLKMTTNAYPNKEFDAAISFIDPVLNTQTRVVTVRVTIQNNNNLLKPGMFVAGNIEGVSASKKQQLIVPASAVMWTGERSVVYVKTNPYEPVFEMREVTIGNRNGETYTITDGLENGDEIVTNGTFTVDAAAQLRGKKSMMNQSNSQDETTIPEMKMKLSQEAQTAIEKSLKPYLNMKDAFVAGNVADVSASAKTTLEQLKLIPERDLGKMEQSHISKIKRMLVAINETDNIKNQRDHFVVLNQNMVPLVMNIKNIDLQLLIQKCPMVNNSKGAFWLSTNKEIRNPYYGEQMMTCGSTIDSLL